MTRIAPGEEPVFVDGNSTYETVSFVDPNFFDFFSYPAIAGDHVKAIQGARNMVLTEAAAEKLLGTGPYIGRTITLDNNQDFTVAAIIGNNPANSHMTSNIFINMELLPTVWGWPSIWESWGSDQLYHYVRLKPNANPSMVSDAAVQFVSENYREDANEWLQIPLQPITDIHFNTELQNEMTVRDSMTGAVKTQRRVSDLYIFAIVGILTLIIAAFNFMNLQIVQITNRLQEVGVRKILGASRRQLISQFMIETVVLSLFAGLIAMVIAELFLPYFGSMLGAELPSSIMFKPAIGLSLTLTILFVTLLTGIYPASIAAKLAPALALKGEVARNVGPAKVRTGLVLIQFSIATGLIIASGVVGSQINFAFSKPLGFDANGVATLFASRSIAQDKYPVIETELKRNPAILDVSYANIVPSQDLSNGFSFGVDPEDPENQLSTRSVTMGYGAFEILGMEIIAGRSFSQEFPADEGPSFSPDQTYETSGLILNETTVRNAGWSSPDEAIGKLLVTEFSRNGTQYRYEFTVVGVVKDTHYRSIRSEIAPMSYMLDPTARQMLIKFDPAREAEALAAIDNIWATHVEDLPIRRSVLEEEYATFYASENRTFSLVIGFAAIAAAIACMGLYGLTAYMVERRVKEVGIRKILGATVTQIVTLLSWDHTKLVVLASLSAWPFVWWLMLDWLAGFAYRAELEPILFIIASLAILSLAAITTSFKTLTAARANPIHALRSE